MDNKIYVLQQRKAVFNDLYHAVQVLRLVDENTPKPQVYYIMWLLERKRLPVGKRIDLDHPFITISRTLSKIFDTTSFEIWWISKKFYEFVEQTDMDAQVAFAYKELETLDPELFRYYP